MTGTHPEGRAHGTLADVLPAALTSIGGRPRRIPEQVRLPEARRAVVVLADGLGDELLRRRSGHAPFLRSALPTARTLTCGFPSTTATSMGSFGTGLPPGAHGMLGYEVLDPQSGQVFNALTWEHGPPPQSWQPEETVFETAAAQGIAVTRIGPHFFDGSGLTTAALRGGQFKGAMALDARVDIALEALRADPRALVYLYWGDIDKSGHVHGVDSSHWGEQLELLDEGLARLADLVPADTLVAVTADHGMVDVPHDSRIDLALEPGLLQDVTAVAGEPRSIQLHCRPGSLDDVAARWRERVGDAAAILTREQIIASGLLGDPQWLAERNIPRLGDVVINGLGPFAVVDSARMRPQSLALIGHHGSTTSAETAIPLLSWAPRQA